jgi:HPt (histidine-containing phosphotransfer) domain-containing protein
VSAPDPAAVQNKIVSELLLDDPEMYDLVEEFVNSLADRATELRQAYEQLDWDYLTTLAHQLKGAGGSYGYAELSELCATMETAFRTHSADEFAAWITQLERLIAAANAGLQSTEPTDLP